MICEARRGALRPADAVSILVRWRRRTGAPAVTAGGAMLIQVILYPGFDELDAIGPFEVLRAAEARGAPLHAELVALDAGEVVAAHGTRLLVERTPRASPFADLLVVPGGGWVARAPRGARAEVEVGRIPALLADAHRAGTILAAVCTGAMLLAAAGLLRGRPAATHSGAVDDLRAAGAEVLDARVVDDGDLVTAGGVTSGLDLGLWLVERFAGPDLAAAVADGIEYTRHPVHRAAA